MKKRIILLVALMAAMMPFVGNAQTTLTVGDNDSTSSYVPVYGFYADSYLRCQTIYPAEILTSMEGETIGSLVYYVSSSASDEWTGTFQVRMKEVMESSCTSSEAFIDMSDAVTVYTGTLNATGSTMVVLFDNPYTYNGGNLLVEVNCITPGTYRSSSFYGTEWTAATKQGYDYSSWDVITGTVRNFMPLTSFVFSEGNGDYCGLTVANGYESNQYAPLYGYYADAFLRCQMIYPEQMLDELDGLSFDTITYFLSDPASDTWGNATFSVKLKVVDNSQFTVTPTSIPQYEDMSDAVTVYEGPLDGTGSRMVIPLNMRFPYYGGNLLVEISTVDTGEYYSCNFYGIESTYATARGYSYSSEPDSMTIEVIDFLPKIRFSCLDELPECEPIAELEVDNITATTAHVHWVGNPDALMTVIAYAMGDVDMDDIEDLTALEEVYHGGYFMLGQDEDYKDLTGLVPDTIYTVGVVTVCSVTAELISEPVYTLFRTLPSQSVATADAASLNVYPNPATNMVAITFSGTSQATVQLMDVSGRVVKNTLLSGGRADIDVSSLPRGSYFVKLVSGESTAVRKLILK